MELRFLGTGEAFDTALPNISILVNDDFLLDCGYNMPQKFWELKLDANQLKTIWMSHFHADHTYGLPAILMRFWEEERTKPLTVVGPKGMEEYVGKLMELAYGDFFSRFKYNIEYKEAEPGMELDVNGYRLKFADTGHSKDSFVINNKEIKKTALAIRVSMEGKSFVYSGDSPYSEAVVKLAKDCDLLIQEAYLPLSTKNELMEQGKAANHCSWEEAGQGARTAGVKKLAIVHTNRYFASKVDDIIQEASQNYKGKVIVPQPGKLIEV